MKTHMILKRLLVFTLFLTSITLNAQMEETELDKLIQETEEWHIFIQKQQKGGKFRWNSSPFGEFIFDSRLNTRP